jgi:hypothetical protein
MNLGSIPTDYEAILSWFHSRGKYALGWGLILLLVGFVFGQQYGYLHGCLYQDPVNGVAVVGECKWVGSIVSAQNPDNRYVDAPITDVVVPVVAVVTSTSQPFAVTVAPSTTVFESTTTTEPVKKWCVYYKDLFSVWGLRAPDSLPAYQAGYQDGVRECLHKLGLPSTRKEVKDG